MTSDYSYDVQVAKCRRLASKSGDFARNISTIWRAKPFQHRTKKATIYGMNKFNGRVTKRGRTSDILRMVPLKIGHTRKFFAEVRGNFVWAYFFLCLMYQFPYYAIPCWPKTFVLKKKQNKKTREACLLPEAFVLLTPRGALLLEGFAAQMPRAVSMTKWCELILKTYGNHV